MTFWLLGRMTGATVLATVGVAAVALVLLSWIATTAVGAQLGVNGGSVPRHCTLGESVTLVFSLRVGRLSAVGGMKVHHIADSELAEPAWWRLGALPAGSTQTLARTFTAGRRGAHRLGLLRVNVIGPFGLAYGTKTFTLDQSIIVRPPLIPLLATPGIEAGEGGRLLRTDAEPDTAVTRAYRPGDEPRRIHWRTSARRGRLMLREHGGIAPSIARLVLDLGLSSPLENQPDVIAAGERAIAAAVSIAYQLFLSGWQVHLVATSCSPLPFRVTDQASLLDWAALLEPAYGGTSTTRHAHADSRSFTVRPPSPRSADPSDLVIEVSPWPSPSMMERSGAAENGPTRRVLLVSPDVSPGVPPHGEIERPPARPLLPADWHVVRYGSGDTLQECWASLLRAGAQRDKAGPTPRNVGPEGS